MVHTHLAGTTADSILNIVTYSALADIDHGDACALGSLVNVAFLHCFLRFVTSITTRRRTRNLCRGVLTAADRVAEQSACDCSNDRTGNLMGILDRFLSSHDLVMTLLTRRFDAFGDCRDIHHLRVIGLAKHPLAGDTTKRCSKTADQHGSNQNTLVHIPISNTLAKLIIGY